MSDLPAPPPVIEEPMAAPAPEPATNDAPTEEAKPEEEAVTPKKAASKSNGKAKSKSKAKPKAKAKKTARRRTSTKARTTSTKAMRYDYDKLLDGKEHVLEQGKDFTGTVRAAAGMIRYRARQRKLKVTAEVQGDKKIRIFAGDPFAGTKSKAKK